MRCTEWNSACQTGIEAVDYEHRLLLDTINATCASLVGRAAADPVLDGLGLLYEKTSAHCALEEKLLRDCGSAQYAARRVQDRGLLERIGTMMDAFYDGSCDACDQSLESCLQSWFEGHLQSAHLKTMSPGSPA